MAAHEEFEEIALKPGPAAAVNRILLRWVTS